MQRIGRGLRQFAGKEDLTYHDFYDYSKPLAPHSKKRLDLYRSEGYEVETI
jgi:superfamily II DNA or RNA helicase